MELFGIGITKKHSAAQFGRKVVSRSKMFIEEKQQPLRSWSEMADGDTGRGVLCIFAFEHL